MDPQLLEKRIEDALLIAERRQTPHFVGFLTEGEAALACRIAQNLRGRFCLWGGFDEADRTFFCALPDWCEPEKVSFPVAAFTLTFRPCDPVSHRDVLGALMALGISRESVGDILVEPGRAVVFLASDIAPYVLSQLEMVGRAGVKAATGFLEPLPARGSFSFVEDTVASARLDCIVAALVRCGRSKSEELIAEGRVCVNSFPCEKCAKQIEEGDRITVRGYGKFVVDSMQGRTKKGRIVLRAKKYS